MGEEDKGGTPYPPHSDDVHAACEVVRAMEQYDRRSAQWFIREHFGRIVRAWVKTLDLSEGE